MFENTVITTTSSFEKIELCDQLGSDHCINYKTKDWEKEVNSITNGKGVDILIDCVGASHWNSNINSMAVDGRLVLYGLLRFLFFFVIYTLFLFLLNNFLIYFLILFFIFYFFFIF